MRIDAAIVPIDETAARPGVSESAGAPSPQAGARVVFTGCVRNHDGGKAVTHLIYQAHPQAQEFLQKTVEETARPFADAGVSAVFVRHFVGKMDIGDVALYVAVDAPHRQQAFELASQLVDQIKAEVPIWKDQYFADGTNHWSNS